MGLSSDAPRGIDNRVLEGGAYRVKRHAAEHGRALERPGYSKQRRPMVKNVADL